MTRSTVGSSTRRKGVANSLVGSLRMTFDEESETSRLEAEIAEEEKPVPTSCMSRFRRSGALILHTKQVLMVIVLLNVIDCLLVTGELILDIHFIKSIGDILEESDLESQRFVDQMQARYPDNLSGHTIDQLRDFHSTIFQAKCYWTDDLKHMCDTRKQMKRVFEINDSEPDVDDDEKTMARAKEARAHSPWEDVSHGLHKASITILGVLFLENLFKIFVMGKRFFQRKIEFPVSPESCDPYVEASPVTPKYQQQLDLGEVFRDNGMQSDYNSISDPTSITDVFDAFVVCASFIVDLVFIKGLIIYRIQDGVLILSFLLPWRVIRVVNSLIVSVLDHEHFRLKMMYKEKKKLANGLEQEQDKTRLLKEKLRSVEDFLEKEGMPRWKFVHYTHFDEKNASVASMASFALKGMVDGFFNASRNHQLEQIDELHDTNIYNVNNNTVIRDESDAKSESAKGNTHNSDDTNGAHVGFTNDNASVASDSTINIGTTGTSIENNTEHIDGKENVRNGSNGRSLKDNVHAMKDGDVTDSRVTNNNDVESDDSLPFTGYVNKGYTASNTDENELENDVKLNTINHTCKSEMANNEDAIKHDNDKNVDTRVNEHQTQANTGGACKGDGIQQGTNPDITTAGTAFTAYKTDESQGLNQETTEEHVDNDKGIADSGIADTDTHREVNDSHDGAYHNTKL